MSGEQPDHSGQPLLVAATEESTIRGAQGVTTESAGLMPESLELPRVAPAMLISALVTAVVVFVRAPGGLDFRGGWLDSSVYDGSLMITAAIAAAAAVAWDLGGFRIQLVALGAGATCGALTVGVGLGAIWQWIANRNDLQSGTALAVLLALAVLMTIAAAMMLNVLWSAIQQVPSRPTLNPVAMPAAAAMLVACPLAMNVPASIGQTIGAIIVYGVPWALAAYLAAGRSRTVAAGASAMLLVDTLGLAYQRDTMIDVARGRMSVVSAVIVLAVIWVFHLRQRTNPTKLA